MLHGFTSEVPASWAVWGQQNHLWEEPSEGNSAHFGYLKPQGCSFCVFVLTGWKFQAQPERLCGRLQVLRGFWQLGETH